MQTAPPDNARPTRRITSRLLCGASARSGTIANAVVLLGLGSLGLVLLAPTSGLAQPPPDHAAADTTQGAVRQTQEEMNLSVGENRTLSAAGVR
ncbi:MAG: hypothetical protein ACM3ZE_01705, partial [Myxococcales bacterium]